MVVTIKNQRDGSLKVLNNVKDIEVTTTTINWDGKDIEPYDINLVHVNQVGQDAPSVWSGYEVVNIIN